MFRQAIYGTFLGIDIAKKQFLIEVKDKEWVENFQKLHPDQKQKVKLGSIL